MGYLGDLIIRYPRPYSIYLRVTISYEFFFVLGGGGKGGGGGRGGGGGG